MTMPVRIIALAVGGEIFLFGHVGAVQTVRGREEIPAGEVSFHEKFWNSIADY
jgi:hypothetical protein